MKKIFGFLLITALLCFARADETAIKLEAYKVLTEKGLEKFVTAEEAAPGDIIEYRAVYTNSTTQPVRNVALDIPIPTGLVAIEGSDAPKAASATVDQRKFLELPILDDQGRPVPYAKLRAFRWNIAELAPGKSATLRIRASVAR